MGSFVTRAHYPFALICTVLPTRRFSLDRCPFRLDAISPRRPCDGLGLGWITSIPSTFCPWRRSCAIPFRGKLRGVGASDAPGMRTAPRRHARRTTGANGGWDFYGIPCETASSNPHMLPADGLLARGMSVADRTPRSVEYRYLDRPLGDREPVSRCRLRSLRCLSQIPLGGRLLEGASSVQDSWPRPTGMRWRLTLLRNRDALGSRGR